MVAGRFFAVLSVSGALAYAVTLPIVDLGYERHQALSYNSTGDFYNFANIRYGASPTGDLRFMAPTAPKKNRSEVQTGTQQVVCPQATPAWLAFGNWTSQYIAGQPITLTQAQYDNLNDSYSLTNVPAQPEGATEDCLFLDIVVPASIYNKAPSYSSSGAAVLVHIHGGGFSIGSKNSAGDPSGLVEQSMAGGNEGVVYVGINYRLGAMGWLAGPDFQAQGVANAGLLDQMFALEWVQKYIHLFGGDPTRVTVFGQGSGAACIAHLITAYGGTKPVHFSRAITQSTGFRLQFDQNILNDQYQTLLSITNTTCVDELQALSSDEMIAANNFQITTSPFAEFTYGAAVDGDLVPGLVGPLFAEGKFAKDVELMVGHTSDEGLRYMPILYLIDSNYTEPGFYNYLVEDAFPTASKKVIDYIQNTLYPPIYNGSYGYADIVGRMALLTSEISFTCNNYYMSKAYNGKDYAYVFAIPPGFDAADNPYVFYNPAPGASPRVLNSTVALVLQDYFTSFAQNGVPKTPIAGVPKIPMWGAKGMAQEFGLSTIANVVDPTDNARCAYWQRATFAK